ncbi:MAG: MarC family protein [Kiritimatiellae bacterium]|nr:MarC family protein [Kiritimatiellia bacterium]
MRTFWICFVPMFVAVDAFGVLPLFINLIQEVEPARIRRVIVQSVVTAIVVALLFLAIGTALLRLLGITVADFMVAGGLLLFVISVRDIMTGEKTQRKVDVDTVGAVPIGVPLITGPAVLTTSILLMNQHGAALTSAVVVINILIAGLIFLFARPISRGLGNAGTKTLSKIAGLLLASIAVMIVRKGVVQFLAGGAPI